MLKVKETGAFVAQSLAKSDKPYLVAQMAPAKGGDGTKVLHIQILALDHKNKNRDYGVCYDIPVGDVEWKGIAEVMHVSPVESYMQHLAPDGLKPPTPKEAVNETPKPKQSIFTFEKLLKDMGINKPQMVAEAFATIKCAQGDTTCFGCVDEQSHQYHKGLCDDKTCEVCWGKYGTCGHADCKACHPEPKDIADMTPVEFDVDLGNEADDHDDDPKKYTSINITGG